MLALVVPTRNEEKNVEILNSRIQKSLIGIPHLVIYVDDSDDSTPELIEKLMMKNHSIRLIHREVSDRSGGLSTAVLEGFAAAVNEANYICVMDADLQHPPELITVLLDVAMKFDADIVVASRYLPGGKTDGLHGPIRKLISLLCALLVRVVFFSRIGSVSDPLGGFFLVSSRTIHNTTLQPFGFKILLDILMRTRWEVLKEVPYQFESRKHGESKASLKQGLLFLAQVAKLMKDKLSESIAPFNDRRMRKEI